MSYYVLENKEVVAEFSYWEWAKWFELTSNRVVGQTYIGDTRVSTVFVGRDNLLFETMVFGGDLDKTEKRYRTWDEAKAGHNKMVNKIKENE